MLPSTSIGSAVPVIRGLYGYACEGIWCEQPYAIIYRGRRKVDGLRVLIKLLRDPEAASWGPDWLQRDYRIAQGLGADCAIKPIAFEQTDLGPALIYVDEGVRPLVELATKAPLDIEAALTLGAKITAVAAALHKERIVHCTLNSSNIWLAADGGVFLADLGCARSLSAEGNEALPPVDALIDVRYMAPEQTGRLEASIDQRTDLYALGVILFRLLTGKVPFDDVDPLKIIDGHVTKQPTFPPELGDNLPAGLVKVILKALAKDPEARYLSADGLLADLIECRSLWRSTGAIEGFKPGRHDAKAVLRVSRRLYGRDWQIAALADKVKAIGGGRPALVLVDGAPGVGKSALLGQLEGFVRKENGRFVSGKFDQYKRNVPYLALIQAFQQLIGQILSESKEQLETWRARILDAVGNNAQVVIDLIPELEAITGPQPSVPTLPPVQARNRFNRVFAKLVQAFAPRDQLLCIVLDDLQWAEASLELLSHILTDPDTKNILFAGAYRDNEVGPEHPLQAMIGALEQAGVDIERLHLIALTEPDILQLVKDTFALSSAEAHDLAQVLHRKSNGDPLYLIQFLHLLCDEGLIAYDHRQARWAWDLPAIQQQAVTDDVLDLLDLRLQALPEDTRTILATAACIGGSFELDKIANAAGRPLAELRQAMTTGIDEGLIITLEGIASGLDPPQLRGTHRFQFLHDRVQQASFDCIPDRIKKEFRLQIGRRLMAQLSPEDERIPQPDILINLNYAYELISDEAERQRVARLNLVAGQSARQALAYQDALGYISIGLRLLDQNAWKSCNDLAFELHSEALEDEYLTANFERADQLFRVLIANAGSNVAKARTYCSKIILDTSEERYEQAIRVGIQALRLFGVRFTERPSKIHLLFEFVSVRLRMRGRDLKDLKTTRELKDAEKLAALRILVSLFQPAYFLSPDLIALTALKIVSCSLRFGTSPISAPGFVVYGMALGAAMDDYRRGYDVGRFAIELAEAADDPSTMCKVTYVFAAMIKQWRDPIDELFPLLDRSRRLALEAGDYQYVNLSINSTIWAGTFRGQKIDDLLRYGKEHESFVLTSKDAFALEVLKMAMGFAAALKGNTTAPHSLDNPAYDEKAAELRYRDSGNLLLIFLQCVLRLRLAWFFGHYREALALSDQTEALVRSASGLSEVADHYLFRGLAFAEDLTTHPRKKTLRRCQSRLRFFARNCPQNFQQHAILLEGEAARVKGHFTNALKLYNRAIELAEAEGFIHLVGLANERAAVCCLAQHERRLARWYLTCARAAYEKWGATAKVAWLDREYASLLAHAVSLAIGTAQKPESGLANHRGERFDIAAALQASQIITKGGDPDRVLSELMQVIRLQAGAETAQLLVLEGGKLRLEASAAAESSEVLLFPASSPDKGPGSFSRAIVNYVLHTGEDLLLAEADGDARFAQCPYIASRRPRSVICSGIRHQGELLGVIYLEHTQIAGAFGGQKLEWLQLLSTELGLTVWSSRLSRYREYVQKFAPSAVSKEIDANPSNPDLVAKDRDVSILFADLAGYTRLAELMGRRQLTELINRAFSRFVDEIHRYDGVLLEIGGDELFVLFADEDHSKHVWKAASAALAISRAAAELKEELSSGHPPLMMNMGINSGVASVGLHAVEAASGSRWRYGASGTVVNIAARVRELAHDGSILMSTDSAARVANEFVFEDVGEHSLKNVMKPIRIYRLISEQQGLYRWGA
jgi:predicted ATPase/class 3 adenylate cyclase